VHLGSVGENIVCHTETEGLQIELNFPAVGMLSVRLLFFRQGNSNFNSW